MSDMITAAVSAINAKLDGKGFEKSIALDIKDEGTIRIDTSGASASDTDTPADCRLIASAKTFQGLMDGSANPMTSVMLGKLKVKGDATIALKLGSVFG